MAEEVVIKVGVDASQATNSLKALKAELKAAQSAALNGDGKAAKRVAELKDKMEDLSDSVKTLKGSGVERANASFGQLGEGLRNLDFDKVKTGFKGLGAAMKAVPIFLIVEGIMYLVQNFNELSKGSGVLAKALQFVGDILSAISDGLTWLTDNLGWTNSALEEMGDKAVEMADKSKDAIAAQSAEYDRLAKEAKMSGESAVKYEVAKQQAIIDTNVAILKQLLAYKDAGGEFTEEQQKLLTTSTAALKAATTERKLILFNEKEEENKKNKESYDKWKVLEDKKKKDLIDQEKDRQAREADLMNAQIDKEEKDAADLKARRAKDLEDLKALSLKRDQEEVAEFMAKEAELKKIQDQAVADHKASEAAKKEAVVAGLNAAQTLSQTFFAIQLNKAKGNAEAEIKIKKRMFEVDKAFNVARAIQDGIRSVQAALTIPPPGGQILAVVNAGLAAANVAKILATKFESGSVGDVSVPTSNVSTNAPNVNTTAPTTQVAQSTTTTKLGENGENLGQRVYVLESDITKSQGRIARLNEQATI